MTTPSHSPAHDRRRRIELLAPAKDLACGIAAIDHGADAVYIGARQFGARVSAGNTVEDIRTLCAYAHQFDARVYVTVNTIIYDDELEAARALIRQVADAGADAVLIQDMALLPVVREQPHLELHASTQTDNRDAAKVAWLRSQGFDRVVLARELSLNEISAIHRQLPDTELEVFVHGALCVSYSGACYASQHCFNRSANRGACAQFCRLSFDLTDADGQTIEHDRHLLSLKDLCQIDELEPLILAGASSLKIEGRLKDVTYVKNVVAAYSQRLDQVIAKHSDKYRRASSGHAEYSFTPNLKKTFNRGFTHYFLHGRQPDIVSFDTPKALGEFVGTVKEIRGGSLTVAGMATFANGDGLCFINDTHKLEGFRVNRVDNNRLFPMRMPQALRRGMSLYRNNDQEFERILSHPTAVRRIGVSLHLCYKDATLRLTATDEAGRTAEAHVETTLQEAQKPQTENIRRQLSKWGNTVFSVNDITTADGIDGLFVPSSMLSELRRRVAEQLAETPFPLPTREKGETPQTPSSSSSAHDLHLANVANREARKFYDADDHADAPDAYENRPTHRQALMTCRYCLRYTLGYCVRNGGRRPYWREPLSLRLPDGKHFQIHFDCKNCQMEIYAE